MSNVNVNELADAIANILNEYKDFAEDEMMEIAKEIAEEGKNKLKTVSPRGVGSKKGHYADGWRVTVERKGNMKFSFVIHNSKKPGLTHLLENGHQMRQGGRARSFPHIKDN